LEGVVAGFGNHRQIELLVDAGFSPEEAIMISSRNGAQYLGLLNEIGTLERGKRANLFLVQGNPDENIELIRIVTQVFKDGIGYDSEALIKSVEGLVGD